MNLATVVELTALFNSPGAVVFALQRRKIRELERDVDECLRDRLGMRQQQQLVLGALLKLLPVKARVDLLEHLEEHLEREDAYDWRREAKKRRGGGE